MTPLSPRANARTPCHKLQHLSWYPNKKCMSIHPTKRRAAGKGTQTPNDSMYNPGRRPNLKGISRVFLYQAKDRPCSPRVSSLNIQQQTKNNHQETKTKKPTPPPFDITPPPPLHGNHGPMVEHPYPDAKRAERTPPQKKTADEPKPHLAAPKKKKTLTCPKKKVGEA